MTLPPKGEAADIGLTWIPMADGMRLSARIWRPAGLRPAPVVLEYIPYRKQDAYRAHDDAWGAALAAEGFAYARVDVRGSGDSEGVLTDEYLESEIEDGCAVIAWLAAQAWCSGAVGMRGLSWGGINTLQIAARRPPALKAILPMGCLDNRYTDDAHYIGGALGHTNFQWGIGFKTTMAGPPDPAVVGEAWEAMWRARLEATPPILKTWLEHQRYDAYWRHGSICEDWAAIEVPTFIVAGWQDTYSNPVSRLLEHLTCPRLALIGPWGHAYPWTARPQGLDWIVEEARWWRHWLTGVDTGIMDEPRLRAFLPYRAPSAVIPQPVPGRWIAEPVWPPRREAEGWILTPGALIPGTGTAAEATLKYRSDRVVGLTHPEWLDRPPVDQTADNAGSLMFVSAPLEADLEILGSPVLRIRIASDQTVAKVHVRLLEQDPDGGSWLVSQGLLNLTHRDGHATPAPLTPGVACDVELTFALTAHRFASGARIALAISESPWPLVWPSPVTPTLTLELGPDSRLSLPVRPRESEPFTLTIPERIIPPPPGAPRPATELDPIEPGLYRLVLDPPPAVTEIAATGAALTRARLEVSEIRAGDPTSSIWRHRAASAWRRGDWDCAVEAEAELTSTEAQFHLTERLVARLGGEVIFERESRAVIDRDLI